MNADLVVGALREAFAAEVIETRSVPRDEVFVTLPPKCIREAVGLLIERFDLRHLSAITGQDLGDAIQLLYHFWDGRGLTLCTKLPPESARIASLTDLIPGAAFFEREVAEMLGITLDGHPDLRVLLMPDDWNGEPVLREGGG